MRMNERQSRRSLVSPIRAFPPALLNKPLHFHTSTTAECALPFLQDRSSLGIPSNEMLDSLPPELLQAVFTHVCIPDVIGIGLISS